MAEKPRRSRLDQYQATANVMAASLGVVTPFGGVAFLAGWAAFAWGAWRTLEG